MARLNPRKWTQQAVNGQDFESESPLQSASEDLLIKHGILAIHLNYRCPQCGFVNKRYSGYPDLILVAAGMELKTEKGKQKNNQKDIEALFKHHNLDYVICRNIQEVLNYAREYRNRR